jgi:hypothetical protein
MTAEGTNMPIETTTIPAERWHRVRAEIVLTDSGKIGMRFSTPSGVRVSHYFEEMPPGLAVMLEQCK